MIPEPIRKHLNVIGGIVGLLKAHSELDLAVRSRTVRHLADHLEQAHLELWRLLDQPAQAQENTRQ